MSPDSPAALFLLGQVEVPTFADLAALVHQILNFSLFPVGGQEVTVVTVLLVGVMLLVTWWTSAILQRAVDGAFRAREVTDQGTTAVAKRLLHYTIMAIGIGIAINHVGINLAALFAAGALFAVGLGFAMQNIAQNFVSGVILLVERAIKPGDIVEVEGRVVRVLKMGIRTTVARTRDDEEIIIPNASLVQSAVKNFTLDDSNYRVRVSVGVSYGSDMRLVRSILEKVAGAQSWGLESPRPVILLSDFGSSSVDWQISVWCNNAWGAPRAASDLREGIWWAFQEEGIEIAFPQLDLHLDVPVQDALTRLPRSA